MNFLASSLIGLILKPPSPYPASAVNLSYSIDCSTGAEATLRQCKFSPVTPPGSCTTGSVPMHVRCTLYGYVPATVRYTPPSTTASTTPSPPASTAPVAAPARLELFEPSVGRWTSISELGWTPVESDRVCRQAGMVDIHLFFFCNAQLCTYLQCVVCTPVPCLQILPFPHSDLQPKLLCPTSYFFPIPGLILSHPLLFTFSLIITPSLTPFLPLLPHPRPFTVRYGG